MGSSPLVAGKEDMVSFMRVCMSVSLLVESLISCQVTGLTVVDMLEMRSVSSSMRRGSDEVAVMLLDVARRLIRC